jgi:hypothetical protein
MPRLGLKKLRETALTRGRQWYESLPRQQRSRVRKAIKRGGVVAVEITVTIIYVAAGFISGLFLAMRNDIYEEGPPWPLAVIWPVLFFAAFIKSLRWFVPERERSYIKALRDEVDPDNRESVAALAARAGREPLRMEHVTEGVDPNKIPPVTGATTIFDSAGPTAKPTYTLPPHTRLWPFLVRCLLGGVAASAGWHYTPAAVAMAISLLAKVVHHGHASVELR